MDEKMKPFPPLPPPIFYTKKGHFRSHETDSPHMMCNVRYPNSIPSYFSKSTLPNPWDRWIPGSAVVYTNEGINEHKLIW